jgi:hypothetical protein
MPMNNTPQARRQRLNKPNIPQTTRKKTTRRKLTNYPPGSKTHETTSSIPTNRQPPGTGIVIRMIFLENRLKTLKNKRL